MLSEREQPPRGGVTALTPPSRAETRCRVAEEGARGGTSGSPTRLGGERGRRSLQRGGRFDLRSEGRDYARVELRARTALELHERRS